MPEEPAQSPLPSPPDPLAEAAEVARQNPFSLLHPPRSDRQSPHGRAAAWIGVLAWCTYVPLLVEWQLSRDGSHCYYADVLPCPFAMAYIGSIFVGLPLALSGLRDERYRTGDAKLAVLLLLGFLASPFLGAVVVPFLFSLHHKG